VASFLTVPTVAGLLCVSPATVRLLIKSGRLRAYRVGNRYKIPDDALHDLAVNPDAPGWVAKSPPLSGIAPQSGLALPGFFTTRDAETRAKAGQSE
jgi:excisionase family DNA binding protein